MLIRDGRITDIVYTHFDPDTNVQMDFNVSSLERDPRLKTLEEVLVLVEQRHGELIYTKRGIEKHRLLRVMQAMQNKVELPPLLFLDLPDGTQLLVEGNHRYLAACVLKHVNIRSLIVPEHIYKRHIITDFPKTTEAELLGSFSGIL